MSLDSNILDVDRVMKKVGVTRQMEFGQLPLEALLAIGAEAHRILEELAVP